MAQEGMAVKCMLTFQYKILTLIKFGQVKNGDRHDLLAEPVTCHFKKEHK